MQNWEQDVVRFNRKLLTLRTRGLIKRGVAFWKRRAGAEGGMRQLADTTVQGRKCLVQGAWLMP